MTWPGESDGQIDDRERRVMRNEVLFREVNERIEDISKEASPPELIDFVCECGEEVCIDTVQLSREEYEEVRAVSDHFAIKPGHEHPDFERVIERHDRYVIIDKVGQADDLAERTDPRS
jgi:hypothetical protein